MTSPTFETANSSRFFFISATCLSDNPLCFSISILGTLVRNKIFIIYWIRLRKSEIEKLIKLTYLDILRKQSRVNLTVRVLPMDHCVPVEEEQLK